MCRQIPDEGKRLTGINAPVKDNRDIFATEPTVATDCQCGVVNPFENMSTGQMSTGGGRFPWQVVITSDEADDIYCVGSIISSLYILTSYHCFYSEEVGYISIGSIEVCLGYGGKNPNSIDCDGSEYLHVDGVILYDVSYGYGYADMVLMRLSEELDLQEVHTVCLPTDASMIYENQMAIATNIIKSNHLQTTPATIIDPSCTQYQLCAELFKCGRDTYTGDSFGPLFIRETNQYFLVGIEPYAVYECDEVHYTSTVEFIDWILRNTADSTYCSSE